MSKKQTNLEYYFQFISNDFTFSDGQWEIDIVLKDEAFNNYLNSEIDNKWEWLMSEYKSPKYKLSKFEYDFLKASAIFPEHQINRDITVKRMVDMGYLKGIPLDVTYNNIFNNCEIKGVIYTKENDNDY